MIKRNIHIDQLQIRLRGVSPHVARSAANELGQELLDQIARSAQHDGRSRTGRTDEIDIGTVTLSGVAEPPALRKVIAQHVAASIFPKSK